MRKKVAKCLDSESPWELQNGHTRNAPLILHIMVCPFLLPGPRGFNSTFPFASSSHCQCWLGSLCSVRWRGTPLGECWHMNSKCKGVLMSSYEPLLFWSFHSRLYWGHPICPSYLNAIDSCTQCFFSSAPRIVLTGLHAFRKNLVRASSVRSILFVPLLIYSSFNGHLLRISCHKQIQELEIQWEPIRDSVFMEMALHWRLPGNT